MEAVLAFFALFLHPFMKNFIFLIVMDNKGGIGKSLIAQVFANLLRYDDQYTVRMLDTDTSNSSTAQIDAEARMVSLTERVGMGVILRTVQDVIDKAVHHIVMDVGAREEGLVKKLLLRLVEVVGKAGGRVVVVRPITLGSHNQRNAVEFMDIAVQLGIAVVFVRNEAQGRHPEFFDRWIASEARAKAIGEGAVETFLEDADVRYADEATGFGISIADAAMRDFNKVPEADRAEAMAFFDLDVAAFLSDWLRQSVLRFGIAVQEALNNVDSRRRASEVASPPQEVTPSGPVKRGKRL